ncbi:hypothetical protein JHW43_006972 [Diplocarpon mali]|nr:hypothetical protein JHW43_006972 [Diplocarpon mali]
MKSCTPRPAVVSTRGAAGAVFLRLLCYVGETRDSSISALAPISRARRKKPVRGGGDGGISTRRDGDEDYDLSVIFDRPQRGGEGAGYDGTAGEAAI